MTTLLTVEQFLNALPDGTILPVNSDDEPDAVKIEMALRQATGIIVARLPWLLDDSGEIAQPVPAQFADALGAMCVDFALFRLTDAVTSSENARNRYNDNMRLLETIDKEHKGGLSGPDNQGAFIVTPSESEGIDDSRFWKKGGVW
ncbi:MAG: DUF1320 domain-containing protein [Spirochaetaceae bacterium]|jgi:phage gp36-like protein|nr:DUF1320 domain-containing protein [Spirochaetaceae bacterium]